MKQSPSWDEQETQFPPPSHPVFQNLREQDERTGYRRPSFSPYRFAGRRWGTPDRPRFSRWDGPWSDRAYREYELEETESNRIVGQVIGAAVLVLVTYVSFHSSHPLAERFQQIAKTVMTQETDFSALSNWMAAHLGDARLALPVSVPGAKTVGEDLNYVAPLASFKLISGFDASKQPGVILQTAAGSEVKTVAKGKVKAYDKNEQYGIYVIVDHGDAAGETLYGHLESVSVKPGDWLYTGQVIGTTGKKDPSDLYFAHFVKNKPVDPQDILARVGR
ncbi:M23 family metallopeptidase [Effusibacillus pohliae]|uniref:M23 family metallopeptidase n=1 Tax=Effusibacillus pohliae TaxID=232270 RepID=UPI00036DB15C|nr:M23 family metallopeptidase [Effusibacillus pohliae]